MNIEYINGLAIINKKYMVTKTGKVFRMTEKEIIEMNTIDNGHGYKKVKINRKDKYIHRLVAECYIPNPNGYKEISHEDNNKSNNTVENLKWCTRSYNNKKMFIDGIKTNKEMRELAKKPKPKSRKYNDNQIKTIKRMITKGYSDTQIYNEVKGSRGAIYQIRKGKTYNEYSI